MKCLRVRLDFFGYFFSIFEERNTQNSRATESGVSENFGWMEDIFLQVLGLGQRNIKV